MSYGDVRMQISLSDIRKIVRDQIIEEYKRSSQNNQALIIEASITMETPVGTQVKFQR